MRFISNARMYAVSPEAEDAWQRLILHITSDAGVPFEYHPYPAPQPLEVLWRRGDLGCVQMCGYPIALKIADVIPIAAPIPAPSWAEGKAVYRSDIIVREQSPFHTLQDTFGHVAGWTVEHSHSGFNAFRHHLLKYRSAEKPTLYSQSVGNLVTARRIIDSVLDGTIDVGPLDAYWHALIAKHKPDLVRGIRVLESTDLAPIPAFVASPSLAPETVDRLRRAFATAHEKSWFSQYSDPLLIKGFEPVTQSSFETTLAWDKAAIEAGYPLPA